MTGSRSFTPGLAPTVQATGTTGAPNAGRFVGVTTSGAPTTGTYRVGDYCLSQNGQLFACTAAGTPGTWGTPSDLRNLITSGEETAPRHLATIASASTVSQTLRLTYFTARKSETTSQVRIYSGGTAAAATPTVCRIGLYAIDAAGAGTLVASTANDTALFAGMNTAYTKSWSAPYAKVAGQRYALGVLVVTSATAPTLFGGALGLAAEAAAAPRLTAQLGSQSDLPASFADASLSTGAQWHYAALLP